MRFGVQGYKKYCIYAIILSKKIAYNLSPIAYFSSHNVVHLAIADNVDVAILHYLDNCGSLLWSFDIIYPSWRVVHADDTPCAR